MGSQLPLLLSKWVSELRIGWREPSPWSCYPGGCRLALTARNSSSVGWMTSSTRLSRLPESVSCSGRGSIIWPSMYGYVLAELQNPNRYLGSMTPFFGRAEFDSDTEHVMMRW